MASPVMSTGDQADAHYIVDLFSGVGGLSLGSARAGFVVRGAVDFESEAIKAHRRNFPNTKHIDVDVSELSGLTLKHRLDLNDYNFAGIVGGPPCQGFSSIGRRDRNDIRNSSFVEFFRVVSEAMPKFFLAENVPGIMQDRYREIREHAFSFVEKGYILLDPLVLTASKYGAATNRKRVFFFGYLPNAMERLTVESFKASSAIETVYVKDALRGLLRKIDPNWQREDQSWRVARVRGNGSYASRLHGHVPLGVGDEVALMRLRRSSEASGFLGTVHTPKVAERYANTECGKYDSISKALRLDLDGFCPTLRAGTGPEQGSFQAVRPIHPTEARVITPREAARLQGFPDWFQFSPTKWHSFRQIGNSVSPILAERILGVVARSLGIADRVEEQVE